MLGDHGLVAKRNGGRGKTPGSRKEEERVISREMIRGRMNPAGTFETEEEEVEMNLLKTGEGHPTEAEENMMTPGQSRRPPLEERD